MKYSVRYNPQAESALSSLNQQERSRINAAIRQLAKSGLTSPKVHRLSGVADALPTYALRASNDLRVVFSVAQDVISLIDVINMRFAQRYG